MALPTLFVSHPDCLLHSMGSAHPESPDRLKVIKKLLDDESWGSQFTAIDAPLINQEAFEGVHPSQHVEALLSLSPKEGTVAIDADTQINPHSLNAAQLAAGAGLFATDEVIHKRAKNAFCAVRPPGHHAESTLAMGFCIFNSVALAAQRALSQGLERVAILDFDVHHGNGTVEIFKDRPEVLVCSSFQYPFYPARFDRVDRANICLSPLAAGTDGGTFRKIVERDWQSAIDRHQPEMIFISAGFDAHEDDPLGGLNLRDDDFFWLTQFIGELANKYAGGRVVSLLEGGYQLEALARSVKLHLQGLLASK